MVHLFGPSQEHITRVLFPPLLDISAGFNLLLSPNYSNTRARWMYPAAYCPPPLKSSSVNAQVLLNPIISLLLCLSIWGRILPWVTPFSARNTNPTSHATCHALSPCPCP